MNIFLDNLKIEIDKDFFLYTSFYLSFIYFLTIGIIVIKFNIYSLEQSWGAWAFLRILWNNSSELLYIYI